MCVTMRLKEQSTLVNRRNDCEAIFELDCKEADCESAVERVPNFESRKEGKQKPMVHRKESPFKGHKSKGHDFSFFPNL